MEDWSPRKWLAEQRTTAKRVRISGCVGRLVRQFESLGDANTSIAGICSAGEGRRPRLSVPASFPEARHSRGSGGVVSGLVSQLEAPSEVVQNPTLLTRSRRLSGADSPARCRAIDKSPCILAGEHKVLIRARRSWAGPPCAFDSRCASTDDKSPCNRGGDHVLICTSKSWTGSPWVRRSHDASQIDGQSPCACSGWSVSCATPEPAPQSAWSPTTGKLAFQESSPEGSCAFSVSPWAIQHVPMLPQLELLKIDSSRCVKPNALEVGCSSNFADETLVVAAVVRIQCWLRRMMPLHRGRRLSRRSRGSFASAMSADHSTMPRRTGSVCSSPRSCASFESVLDTMPEVVSFDHSISPRLSLPSSAAEHAKTLATGISACCTSPRRASYSCSRLPCSSSPALLPESEAQRRRRRFAVRRSRTAPRGEISFSARSSQRSTRVHGPSVYLATKQEEKQLAEVVQIARAAAEQQRQVLTNRRGEALSQRELAIISAAERQRVLQAKMSSPARGSSSALRGS